jgi:hypothetical protein
MMTAYMVTPPGWRTKAQQEALYHHWSPGPFSPELERLVSHRCQLEWPHDGPCIRSNIVLGEE